MIFKFILFYEFNCLIMNSKEQLFDIADYLKKEKRNKNKYSEKDIVDAVLKAAELGYLDLIKFFMTFLPKRSVSFCTDVGVNRAAKNGHSDIVVFFITKSNASINNLSNGLQGAAEGGQKDLVDFFISIGANHWNYAMESSAKGGHMDLVNFFISKGAETWDYALLASIEGRQKSMMDFFISKGADPRSAIEYAIKLGHKDLANYLVFFL